MSSYNNLANLTDADIQALMLAFSQVSFNADGQALFRLVNGHENTARRHTNTWGSHGEVGGLRSRG